MAREVAERQMSASLAVVAQRRQAAHDLWRQGHLAESLMLMASALAQLRAIANGSDLAHTAGPIELEALAREYGELHESLAARGFRDEHARWLERARLATLRVERELSPPSRRSAQRKGLLVGVAALLASATLITLQLRRVHPLASGEYSTEFPARYAVDGLTATEWLLPDKQLGWLELRFATPRTLAGLTITNAHNRHYMDRGVKQLRALFYSDEAVVQESEVEFSRPAHPSAVRRIAVHGKRVTRIRLEVKSYWELGGGLAEVIWD